MKKMQGHMIASRAIEGITTPQVEFKRDRHVSQIKIITIL